MDRVAMIKFAQPEQYNVFVDKDDPQTLSQDPESNGDANSQSSTSSVTTLTLNTSSYWMEYIIVHFFCFCIVLVLVTERPFFL